MAPHSDLPDGFRLAELTATGSTNADCVAAATRGESGNLWIRADRQSAGRGSRGRDWISQKGNLFASVLVDVPARTIKLPTLTFAASLALADALQECAEASRTAPEIAVKWPNDVLLEGGKVAGILLESHVLGKRHVAVTGFGVNCVSHPAETGHRATHLADHGLDVEARQLLGILARCFARRLEQWRWGHGFAEIRADWLARAAGLDAPIEIRLPDVTHRGRFETVDEDGLIVIAAEGGSRERFSVADVFLLAGEAQRG